MEKHITLGTQTVTYNADSLVITSEVDYSTCKRESIAFTSFTNDTDVFLFDVEGEINSISFTSGENYVGDYDTMVHAYVEDDGYTIAG